MRKLNPKQELFVEEYMKDLNATAAALRAGYKHVDIGRRLVTKSHIIEAIQAKKAEVAERLHISQDDVLRDLLTLKTMSMGDERYDGKTACKALELIGKHAGMFGTKVEVSGPGGKDLVPPSIHIHFVPVNDDES